MSSTGGSGGVGGGTSLHVYEGMVELEGQNLDVTTTEGYEAAEAVLGEGQMGKLQELMRAAGYELKNGCFVESDEYETKRAGLDIGPNVSVDDLSEEDKELLNKVFVDSDVPSPFNANTTWKLYDQVKGTPGFESSTQALTNYLENPTPENKAKFMEVVQNFAETTDNLNVYELLFLVMRESIHQTNQDKMYFLSKIKEFNNVAEGLSEYLQELVVDSQELDELSQNSSEPDKVTVPVDTKNISVSGVDSKGKAFVSDTGDSPEWTRTGLDKEIKKVESMQETVRNNRQQATTSFQNFDSKSNQMMNLLTSVVKTLNEMRQGTTRNLLG